MMDVRGMEREQRGDDDEDDDDEEEEDPSLQYQHQINNHTHYKQIIKGM